jgi:hypothetical protein
MSTRSRILHLPSPMDTRTCSRWACLQRIPGTGPDPAILSHHVERAVNDIAATVIEDAEVKGSLQATEHYVTAFLDRYWPAIPALVGPGYPKSLVVVAEERGAMCIETLVERVVPRLQYTEQLLAHAQSFEWRIPDGAGGELVIPGVIARLGEDRLTSILRIYEWQIEEQTFPYLNAFLRFQQIGVTLGWLQTHVTGGREFLRETLVRIRVEDGEARPTVCPVCGEAQGKISPQHMKTHGLTVEESYRRFPGLGFSKKARLLVQPSQEGILRNAQVFGLIIAGAGFEPATFGLCIPLQLSLPG